MKLFKVHPATFLFLILLLITGFSKLVFPYLISILLHEFAHGFIAKKLGYKLNEVWILPYGASITFKEYSFNPNDEIKIAIAGPLMNFILIVITIMLWWIFPSIYTFTYPFVITNFSIALFNLLPAFPLDGGRILNSILKSKLKNNKVYKISSIINFIISVIFFLLFIVSCFIKINFSFGLISIFIFLGIIESKFQGSYSPLLENISHKNKLILPIKSFLVSSNVPIYKILPEMNKNKYNIIYVKFNNERIKVLTENNFKKIIEVNSLDKTLEDVFK